MSANARHNLRLQGSRAKGRQHAYVGVRTGTQRVGLAGRCASVCRVRPNPSLEPTRSGVALGPRGACSYHPPRGPSATPALAAQLKR